MSTGTTLQDLRNRHNELQRQLTRMQVQHETMDTLHTQQYLHSIQASMKSLLEVIIYVRKADKNLVHWHHRSDKLKSALRLVGLDRRTNTVIEKKTEELKARVLAVESKFDGANNTVAIGLRATENLKSDFVHFSQNSLDPISRETVKAQSELDNSHETLEYQIERQRVQHSMTETRMRDTSTSLARTISERQGAEDARGVLAAGSFMGFGVAAISAVMFPPSLLFTGTALAAGAGAGALACVANEDASKLEAEQRRLTTNLSSHEESIEALKLELSGLNLRKGELADAIKLVEALNAQTSKFKVAVQQNINYIRETKVCLDKTRLKLTDIIRKLHECQYEETRRCIATRLREVLETVQAVPTKKIAALEPGQVRRAMQYLSDIDNRTGEVMRILRVC